MQIGIINSAGLDDRDVALWADACDRQLLQVCGTYRIPYTPVVFYARPDNLPVASGDVRLLTIVKSLNIPGAEGIHQNLFGLVFSRVEASDQTSVDMSHEIIEQGVNPYLDRWVTLPDGREIAKEISDPCEDESYLETGSVGDIERPISVSDYVLPSYFDPKGRPPYDRKAMLGAPFSLTPGGYYVVKDAAGVRSAVFASRARDLRAGSRGRRLTAE